MSRFVLAALLLLAAACDAPPPEPARYECPTHVAAQSATPDDCSICGAELTVRGGDPGASGGMCRPVAEPAPCADPS